MRRQASHLLADDVLLARTRDGDRDAYGELWLRHSTAAYAVARAYPRLDADDVVAEAFSRILAALSAGRGPDQAFRPYLLTTVRNVIRDWGTRPVAETVDDLDQTIDPAAIDAEDATIAALERTAASTAFRGLPTRWQEALWYSEVDGLKPRQFAPLLGLAPNAASALVVRARRAFRDAWITTQLSRADSPECALVLGQLGAHTRGAVSARQRRVVDEHLAECTSCAIAWTEARDVASRLVLVLLPLCAGAAGATGYLAWAHEGGAAVAAAVSPLGSTPPRAGRDGSAATRTGLVAAAVAGVAAVAVAATLIVNALPSGEAPSSDALSSGAVTQQDPAPPPAPEAPPAPQPSPTPTPAPDPSPSAEPNPGPPPSRPSTPKEPGSPLPGTGSPSGSTPTTEPPAGEPSTGAPPSGGTDGTDPTTPTTPVEPDPLPAPTMAVDTSAGPLVYPLVSGADAVPGSVIDLIDEDDVVLASTTAGDDGAWSIGDFSGAECSTDPASYLQAGEHTLRARQTSESVQSPAGEPATFTLADPPVFLAPTAGAAVSHSGFELAFTGEPDTTVQRIRVPDESPCRPVPMVTDASGSYSATYSVPAPETFTLGLRYIDVATGRHGAAVFVTVTAE
ncbi:hypothetical protein GCM10010988_32510 [Cnuibacter physcomitrellae]|uniref:Uncharacterized protein n=1 Tax=Cnuibacter physcomitrellae TaxID=1619308 RepID=A0A1X9LGY3_9MICO|nr:sigma-70 family RNA polymerase sigma factor [Cnuibacter physcomitrellae]ARJ04465.1 hypothetical protein B5808_03925 [Cnuibacter physcomitrellae]GGI41122.1 hypothetical protein GCM10010988_32510 [Cnuibacter physcomitrellae]